MQKTSILASGPVTSWQIDGETVESVTDFIFLGSKITADGDCSHEITTPAPWKKSYDQPRQHIKKRRHYFANKGPSGQSCGFSSSRVWLRVGPYRRLSAKELMLSKYGAIEDSRVSWAARRSNQLILKEIKLNIHWKD